MYHIGLFGIFCLLLLRRRFFMFFCVILTIFIIIYKPIVILYVIGLILLLYIPLRYNKTSKALRNAADSVVNNDAIFLNFKFDMSKEKVDEYIKKLIKENKRSYINYGANLVYKLAQTTVGIIDFSFYNNKLYKLTLSFKGITKEELKSIIHKEICNKEYAYYNSWIFSEYHYIKQNIIITINYKEIQSNVSGVPNTKITKMEYINAIVRKEIQTEKKEILIGNPNDF